MCQPSVSGAFYQRFSTGGASVSQGTFGMVTLLVVTTGAGESATGIWWVQHTREMAVMHRMAFHN